jgi:D-alanine--poly(phosphoribitol) ligase subunit 2
MVSDVNTLRERITALFASVLHLEVPSFDTDLFETGVFDSLAFVELLLRLERDFGMSVSVEELEVENFRSIATIAEFVHTRTSRRLAFGG